MSHLAPLTKRDMPKPLPLKFLLGPSFIILGMGLGSGELILWPYLASNFGMGIIWAAVLGITFQFFLNMEIERYTLVSGESIFVGLTRKYTRLSPVWFIFSTLVPWVWPGIIASSATFFAYLFGIIYTPIIPIILLLVIGLILTLGPIVYKTQEVLQRTLIFVGVPLIFFLVLFIAKLADWEALGFGLMGKGEGYWFLPAGISLTTFLGAFAYAGAGGNLNLAQSYYVKEKGYGMGKFSGRLTSILTGKTEKISLEGTTFVSTPSNMQKFKTWWWRINVEHSLIFWLTGALTILALSFLAFSTTFDNPISSSGVGFVISESQVIAEKTMPFLGSLFLLIAALMLFSTQFSVMDATSRIMSENLVILAPKRFRIEKLSLFYYLFLWILILSGIVIFMLGFTEPLTLVITGATLNAFSMFIYTGLVLGLNLTHLAKPLRPGWIRVIVLFSAFSFYGIFSGFVIWERLFS
ncbi:MAG: hypothetical protein UV74_C0013G0191 [Candidatus Woesebacteria bacterium GW2011_GWB1_43_14]|uniref:Divalent metal cation transporter n=1 Tax=Candidatus Woesebacteria bacterium GW2011_GWB1_43_14 TaxID=1618578 RepID=A0A0G1DH85_9BACT|nr:MAG: hypothetical protein UV51_C0005G0030 [Candidatus Woesebacteria bacterium GW2011_GWC1_42_9]KKS97069.1 MAG: hypothetical protein UV74_C0013G0191 [Candidatus Woesebacteria bacterium GW2011_GWB1_43_14]